MLIDSTIIIGMATVLIYFLSVSFYKGFYNYYGINDFDIAIGISEIITAIKAIMPIITMFIMLSVSVLFVIHLQARVHRHLIYPITVSVFVISYSFITFAYVGWKPLLNIIPLIIIWLNHFILPVMHFKKGKTISEKLDLYDEDYSNMVEKNETKNKEFGKVLSFLSPVFIGMYIIFVVLSTSYEMGYGIGKSNASFYSNYLIFTDPELNHDYVLVYHNNEAYIFMPMADENSLLAEYKFISISELNGITLKPLNRKLTIVGDVSINDSPNNNENDIIKDDVLDTDINHDNIMTDIEFSTNE